MTKEEALALVRIDGRNIKDLDEEYRRNRDIVLEAVLNNGHAMEHIDDPFILDDKEIVLIACHKCGSVELWANKISDRLKKDKDIAKMIAGEGLYDYIDKSLLLDKEVSLELVKNNTENFIYLPKELQYDKEFIIDVINEFQNLLEWIDFDDYHYFSMPSVLAYVPKEIVNDKDFMKRVISISKSLIEYIGDDLKNDPDFKDLYIKIMNAKETNNDEYFFDLDEC